MRNLWKVVAALAIALPAAALVKTDYVVSIENTMGHEMDFYYNDADSTVEKLLGSVPGNEVKEFVVKSPASTSITIIERGDAMPNWSDKRPVTLQADSVVELVF